MRYLHRRTITFPERMFAIAVLAVTLHLSFPQFSHAAVAIDNRTADLSSTFVMTFMRTRSASIEAAPRSVVFADRVTDVDAQKGKHPRRVLWVMVTAYSSEPRQTDGSPYITAKNTFVRDGVIAANFLPFNTRVRMPTYFGDKELVVEDRMHERFSNRIDVWMPSKAEAKQWGARVVKVEVL